ncbi:MAG: LysR family transcriptional regulator [Pusillimonas sp.]|nr:LysR family transcriptional regulator [Pusillimonas sp.]MBC42460.1 LysR family transcriptional regulator [Pusillimonas sp.]HCP76365.1 LysR family transcriptional regulator [Pusillimonas sp.]|tara:strand:+ start:7789 stop:8694 length:906 start_codon:yes stop_codon:yes gene_type:complete
MKKLANIDLKLLQLFDEICQTRNLSRAAENLNLTQPAVSLALGRLRQHFGDPLFVRVGGKMVPTPIAEQLHELVAHAIALLEATIAYQPRFDPAGDSRLFRIAMTDVGQIVVLPHILNTFRDVAPHIQVDVITITNEIAGQLQHGDVDLALGFVPDLDGRYIQQKLFEDGFSCLVREGHPRVKDVLTVQSFQDEEHVIVKTSGTGHLIIEHNLQQRGLHRKVGVQVPNFIGVATVVDSSNLIATLPGRAAQLLARAHGVRAMKLPVDMPSYSVRQSWHERMQHDPAHKWLRTKVAEIFNSG